MVEQAPPATGVARDPADELLVLSAKTASALEAATERLAGHLRLHPGISLREAAHTLQSGRRAFRHRRALVCRSTAEAVEILGQKKSFQTADTQNRKSAVAFLFPGQGAQQAGMGRDFYEREPVFRARMDECCELLAPELGLDLREVLYPRDAASPEAQARLTQTALTQPALFVVEYALAQTWLARGVQPQVLAGHSLGEYVAAVLAGIFTLKDALHLLAVRGRLMQSLPPGAMLAVALGEGDLAPWLDDSLALAAVNGPRSCVVSGSREAVAALEKTAGGKEYRIARAEDLPRLPFRNDGPDPGRVRKRGARVPRLKPQIPIVSSLYGREATDAEWTDPAYWSAQLRRTVRFADALAPLLSRENLLLLEVGPGQTLTALARQHAAKKPGQLLAHSCARPGRNRTPRRCSRPRGSFGSRAWRSNGPRCTRANRPGGSRCPPIPLNASATGSSRNGSPLKPRPSRSRPGEFSRRRPVVLRRGRR